MGHYSLRIRRAITNRPMFAVKVWRNGEEIRGYAFLGGAKEEMCNVMIFDEPKVDLANGLITSFKLDWVKAVEINNLNADGMNVELVELENGDFKVQVC